MIKSEVYIWKNIDEYSWYKSTWETKESNESTCQQIEIMQGFYQVADIAIYHN